MSSYKDIVKTLNIDMLNYWLMIRRIVIKPFYENSDKIDAIKVDAIESNIKKKQVYGTVNELGSLGSLDSKVVDYEIRYSKFLGDIFKDSSNINKYEADQIDRYLTSFSSDIKSIYWNETDKKTYFYNFETLTAKDFDDGKAKYDRLKAKCDELNKKYDLKDTTVDNSNKRPSRTNPIEDAFLSIQSRDFLDKDKEYSREVILGNQNNTLLYLLQIHINNLKELKRDVRKKDITDGIKSFLQLHYEDKYNDGMVNNLRNVVNLLQDMLNVKEDNQLFDELHSKKINNYSYIEVLNWIVRLGDKRLEVQLDEKEYDGVVNIVNNNAKLFDNIMSYNRHLTHVFDLSMGQFNNKFFNMYLYQLLIDYNLIPLIKYKTNWIYDITKANYNLSFINYIGHIKSTKGLIFRTFILSNLARIRD